jgi:hypothetical protein
MAYAGLARCTRPFSLGGVLVLLLFVATLVFSAAPAAAHDDCIHHPTDPDGLGFGAPNSHVCLKAGHSRLDVCDSSIDGHRVWGRVGYTNGDTVSFFDQNGGDPGCGNYYPTNHSNGFYISFNVCVEAEGCGNPHYRPGWGSPTW